VRAMFGSKKNDRLVNAGHCTIEFSLDYAGSDSVGAPLWPGA